MRPSKGLANGACRFREAVFRGWGRRPAQFKRVGCEQCCGSQTRGPQPRHGIRLNWSNLFLPSGQRSLTIELGAEGRWGLDSTGYMTYGLMAGPENPTIAALSIGRPSLPPESKWITPNQSSFLRKSRGCPGKSYLTIDVGWAGKADRRWRSYSQSCPKGQGPSSQVQVAGPPPPYAGD